MRISHTVNSSQYELFLALNPDFIFKAREESIHEVPAGLAKATTGRGIEQIQTLAGPFSKQFDIPFRCLSLRTG